MGRSLWAAHWAQGPGANWGQAAAILKRKVVVDPSLLGVLLDLEGGAIASTCPLAARCCGDVLISIFFGQRELKSSASDVPSPSGK